MREDGLGLHVALVWITIWECPVVRDFGNHWRVDNDGSDQLAADKTQGQHNEAEYHDIVKCILLNEIRYALIQISHKFNPLWGMIWDYFL